MSKIALTPNASGTGTLTIAAPDTNTDRTITLPDATGTVVLADATQTLTNKSIAASQLTDDVAAARITGALNATGSAPIYACRAWVNFNGIGTVAIRASGNVSSITDNGVGDYTVNFTTAMPDANYSYSHSYSAEVNVQHAVGFLDTITAGSLRVRHFNAANSANSADKSYVFIAIFR